MPDHIHLLIKMHSQVTIASLAQHLKGASSKWIDDWNKVPAGFSWSRGYGAFSVEPRNVEMIINYIKKQKEHHNYRNTIDDYEI